MRRECARTGGRGPQGAAVLLLPVLGQCTEDYVLAQLEQQGFGCPQPD
jgi:hypothetical protein